MEITVTFRHFDSNDSLKEYVEDKVSKLEKYINYVNEAHVVLSLEKRRHIAEVVVNANKTKITAKEVSEENMYAAIDLVMNKIERQAQKFKDKQTSYKDHYKRARHNILEYQEALDQQTSLIVKTETVNIKPLSVDDAVLEINASGNDFLVFKNSESDKVNLLYKRTDGNLGLIEPVNQ